MPYYQRPTPASVSADHSSLVKAITGELKGQPQTLSQAALGVPYEKPTIIEGTIRNTDRLELYVVWKRWSGVREEHRTAAILEAYEKEFGEAPAKRVVIALGLTPEEARDLGIIDGSNGVS